MTAVKERIYTISVGVLERFIPACVFINYATGFEKTPSEAVILGILFTLVTEEAFQGCIYLASLVAKNKFKKNVNATFPINAWESGDRVTDRNNLSIPFIDAK